MSNDNTQQVASQSAAPDVTAIKSELDTKLAAVNEQLAALNQMMQRQSTDFNQIAASLAPKQKQVQEEYDPYNPEDYANKIARKAADEARRAVAEENKRNLEKQAAINSLAGDYPELNDSTSEFAKKVVAIHSSLDPSLQGTGMGYKIAAREAAADLGVLPKSKRQSNDDFVMGGGSSSQSTRKPARKADDLSDNTLLTAELMGLNVKDPKVIENLKSHQQRFGQVNVSKYK